MPVLSTDTLLNQRYRIERHLGGGGLGQVYLARDALANEQPVALKTLEAADVRPEVRDALRLEFAGMTRLQHPNLVSVYDYGEVAEDGVPFFTMEYVDGSNFLVAAEDLAVDEICDCVAQLCRALEYLHSRKCVHRDLKPSNILVAGQLDGGSLVKVLDFGLVSRAAAVPNGQTAAGTPQYMAPELFLGESAGLEADLYSLGVVLYEVACGALPFEGDTIEAVAWQHVHTPPEQRAGANPLLGHALWPVIERLLAKKPGDRYANALEVIRALSRHTGVRLRADTSDTLEGYFSSSPFVGRDRELQASRDHVRTVADPAGASAPLLIEGRAGLGKTRLLEELRYHCQLENTWFFGSRCPAGPSAPYAPLQQVLSQALPAAGLGTPGAGEDFVGLCETAARYAGVPPPDRQGRLDSSQVNAQLADIVFRFLTRLADERPLIVSLDDLQNADSPTAEIVGYVARNAANARFSLCLAYRGEELGESPARAVVEELAPGAACLELQPLSADDLSALVTGMLGQVELPSGFAEKLHSDTAGNPFFLIESLRLHAQEGLLKRQGHVWHLSEAAMREATTVPSSLRELVARRVGVLPRDPLRVVQVLAVCGEPLAVGDLARVLGDPAREVSVWVAHLIARDLAQREPGSGRIDLVQPELGRTLYADLSPVLKRRLHARVGALLERKSGGQPERGLAQLAAHFLRAGDAVRGREYGLAAAEELRGAFANAEALRLYEDVRALGPAPDIPTKTRLCEGLADVYRFTGEPEKAKEWGAAGIAACGTLAQREVLCRLHRIMGSVCEGTGDYDEAQEHYEEACELLSVCAPPRDERARVYDGAAQLAIRRGNLDEALALLSKATSALGATRDNAVAASIYTNTAVAHQLRQERDDALWCFEKSMAIRRRIGDLEGLSRSLNNKGTLHRSRGECERALRCYEQSIALKERLGNRRGLAASYQNVANIHALTGDHARAREEYERALDVREKIGDKAGAASSLLGVGQACRRLGAYDEAVSALHRCVALHAELGTSGVLALSGLASVLTELGADQEAKAALTSALAEAERPQERATVLRAQARLCAAQQRWEDAEHALRQARQLVENQANTHEACGVALTLAEVALRRGRIAEAEALLSQSEERHQHPDRSSDTCQLLCLRAELHAERKEADAALALFEKASDFAEKTGDPEAVWKSNLGAARIYRRRRRHISELKCCERMLLALREACLHLAETDWQVRYLATRGRAEVLEFVESTARRLQTTLGE